MVNKKQILQTIVLAFLLIGLIFPVDAIPDSFGRGVNQPTQDSIIYDVKELNFFEKIFIPFSLIGLSSSYTPGQTISVRVSERLNQFCSGPSYVVMEVYRAPVGQQTTSTYVGGNNFRLVDNLNPNSFSASFNYNLPSSASGTWSMSGYIYCPSKDPTPATSYSSVTEQNFNIQTTQPPQCTNECTSGTKICTTQGGYRNRYVTTCGNYDSDSCTEYQTSGLTDCGGIDKCSDGQCISTPPPTTQQPNIQVISTNIELQGKQAIGNIILKNNGVSMTQNYVVEMQVVSQSSSFFSIAPSTSQNTCDSNYPQNVHLPFNLGGGVQQQYTLVSPQTGELQDGTYKAIFYLRTKCYDGTSDTRQVPGAFLSGYEQTDNLKVGVGTGDGTGDGGTNQCGTVQKGLGCPLPADTKIGSTVITEVQWAYESQCSTGICLNTIVGQGGTCETPICCQTGDNFNVKKEGDLCATKVELSKCGIEESNICKLSGVGGGTGTTNPDEVDIELHKGINPKDVKSATTEDLIASSCTKTEQCESGSTCNSLKWYIDNGHLTEDEAGADVSTIRATIAGTALGTVLGTIGGISAASAIGICVGATAATAGLAAPVCFGIIGGTAIAGAVVGSYAGDLLGAISEKNINKFGYCTLEKTSENFFDKVLFPIGDFEVTGLYLIIGIILAMLIFSQIGRKS